MWFQQATGETYFLVTLTEKGKEQKIRYSVYEGSNHMRPNESVRRS